MTHINKTFLCLFAALLCLAQIAPAQTAPVYTTLEGIYGLQINQVMSGASTPQAALEVTNTLFNNILSGNTVL